MYSNKKKERTGARLYLVEGSAGGTHTGLTALLHHQESANVLR